VRVLVGKRTGSAFTSDFSDAGLRHMVASALDLAKITTEDPHAGLPDPEELGSIPGDLQLFHGDIETLETPFKIEQAKLAECAALDADPRISTSEGASFDTYHGSRYFANSRGFSGGYRTSTCSLSVVPIAKDGEAMERDYWFSMARSYAKLENPEEIGKIAAKRVLRRLGARKVATQKVPVVFDPRVSRSIVEHVFEAATGDAIYRKASFLAGELGKKVASGKLTIIDDGTMAGGFGTSPFDDEGVPSRRTVVVERGVLKSYLLNTYTARKLGLKTTGNAARGITGNAGVGHGNMFVEPGEKSVEAIISSVKNGFYVTELMGFGVNIVTGDYSRGAVGLWIENGALAYAVHEVTISSTLPEMLNGIEAIASDLEFRGSMAAPAILVGEMTISGH
jgi:PmbA protein